MVSMVTDLGRDKKRQWLWKSCTRNPIGQLTVTCGSTGCCHRRQLGKRSSESVCNLSYHCVNTIYIKFNYQSLIKIPSIHFKSKLLKFLHLFIYCVCGWEQRGFVPVPHCACDCQWHLQDLVLSFRLGGFGKEIRADPRTWWSMPLPGKLSCLPYFIYLLIKIKRWTWQYIPIILALMREDGQF